MFALNTDERKAVLFFTALILLGIGVSYAVKKNPPIKKFCIIESNFCKIDLNTADEDALDSVPGIGRATARKIVEYRKENGSFNTVDDLRNIKGISPNKLEEIKDFFFVE